MKFFVEQVHELFFYIEWLISNYEKYQSKQSLYRKEVLKRSIQKIIKVGEWIRESNSFTPSQKLSTLELNVEKIENDIILNNSLKEVSIYLNSIDTLVYYDNLLPREFSWFESNEVVEYQDDCNDLVSIGKYSFIRGEIQDDTRKDKILFSPQLSSLFIKLGCFHFDHLVNFSINTQSRLCGTMIKLFIHSLLIEGNKSILLKETFAQAEELSKMLNLSINLFSEKPFDLKNKSIFITVNWGHDDRRFRAFKTAVKKMKDQSYKFDWFHFDLLFEEDRVESEFPKDIQRIILKGNRSNQKLWLKENLYNFAAHYTFGAKNYIFSDADVYSENKDWIKILVAKLDSEEFDFIHGFKKVTDTEDHNYAYESWTKKYLEEIESFTAPGLVWAIPRKTYILLEFIPDIFPDGSNDGALIQELTNKKMGGITKFDWYSSRIRTFKQDFKITYCDVDVVHVNHGVSRDYINRVTLLDLVKVPFEQMYAKNELGIYQWSENEDYQVALGLSQSYFELDSKSFISLIDTLVKKDIIKIPKEMIFWSEYPSKHYLDVKNGIAFLYPIGNDRYKVVTSSLNKKPIIKFRWATESMMDNEHLYIKFNAKKDPKTHFDISVNYNWWRLAGSNNLYDKKYFTNLIEQPLAICASSWADHAITFIDIESLNVEAGASFELEKQSEERINIFHSWKYLEEVISSYDELKIVKNSFDIPLSKDLLNKKGWFRIDIKFKDIEKIPLKITVVNGLKSIPITTTRLFDDSTCDYLRILFYRNVYMNDLKLRVKLDIKKEVKFNEVKMILNERKKL